MAFIHPQASGGGTNQHQEVLAVSGAYETPIEKHITVVHESTRETRSSEASRQQQQQQQQQHQTITIRDESNHAESANTTNSNATGQHRQQADNEGSLLGDASGVPAGINKIPNSYKYPCLKKYFEFGPWIGRNRKALCLACRQQSSSSQPDRLLKHLNRCNSLSEADKGIVTELMNERTANKRKKPMQLKIKRDNDTDSEYYNAGDQNSDDLSLSGLNSSQNSISIPPGGLKKLRRDHSDRNSQIDGALTRFIMVCRIPLKAIHSREFVELVRALDPDYRIPSRETITNVLIPGLLNII